MTTILITNIYNDSDYINSLMRSNQPKRDLNSVNYYSKSNFDFFYYSQNNTLQVENLNNVFLIKK